MHCVLKDGTHPLVFPLIWHFSSTFRRWFQSSKRPADSLGQGCDTASGSHGPAPTPAPPLLWVGLLVECCTVRLSSLWIRHSENNTWIVVLAEPLKERQTIPKNYLSIPIRTNCWLLQDGRESNVVDLPSRSWLVSLKSSVILRYKYRSLLLVGWMFRSRGSSS